MRALALFALALTGLASASYARSDHASSPVVDLGGDGWLVPGRHPAGQQPDGNSIILKGPGGLVVVDSGRNPAHAGLILRAVSELGDTPVAVVNTHWHLDHVSGNPTLRRGWPGIRVYGTSAIDKALTGFLANSAAVSRKALAEGKIPAGAVEGVRHDLATIERGGELRPDVVVDESRDVVLGGRPLSLRVAPRAATARDLWIYDAAAKRAIVGDLVTLPAPFLDTACPEGWLAALDDVAETEAEQVVPGHGAVMGRPAFGLWRSAFGNFIACARGPGTLETCSSGWVSDAASLIGDDGARAKTMADYYGALVRSGKLDGYCKA